MAFVKDDFFAFGQNANFYCGLGRDRTGDLTIFSRSLVPTELPSQTRFHCHSPKRHMTPKPLRPGRDLNPRPPP